MILNTNPKTPEKYNIRKSRISHMIDARFCISDAFLIYKFEKPIALYYSSAVDYYNIKKLGEKLNIPSYLITSFNNDIYVNNFLLSIEEFYNFETLLRNDKIIEANDFLKIHPHIASSATESISRLHRLLDDTYTMIDIDFIIMYNDNFLIIEEKYFYIKSINTNSSQFKILKSIANILNASLLLIIASDNGFYFNNLSNKSQEIATKNKLKQQIISEKNLADLIKFNINSSKPINNITLNTTKVKFNLPNIY